MDKWDWFMLVASFLGGLACALLALMARRLGRAARIVRGLLDELRGGRR